MLLCPAPSVSLRFLNQIAEGRHRECARAFGEIRTFCGGVLDKGLVDSMRCDGDGLTIRRIDPDLCKFLLGPFYPGDERAGHWGLRDSRWRSTCSVVKRGPSEARRRLASATSASVQNGVNVPSTLPRLSQTSTGFSDVAA